MTIPTITVLPVAPARTDTPAVFNTRADAFLGALYSPFSTQMNASIGAINTDIGGIAANVTLASEWAIKNDAAVSGTDWSAFANASGASPTGSAKAWATTAQDTPVSGGEYSAKHYSTEASDSATAAASSATAAANTANAAMWVSGQAYAEGDNAISGVNYKTYRATTATSGTTDPSASGDWNSLAYNLPSQSGNSGKFLTTNGTDESWGDALPDQTGNTGKVLTTDGTDAAWADVTSGVTYPQNSQSADYTLVIGDAGKSIYHPSADTTPRTFTIPANASVPFAIGDTIIFVNDSNAGILTIAITSDTIETLSGVAGPVVVSGGSVVTALKVTATKWLAWSQNQTASSDGYVAVAHTTSPYIAAYPFGGSGFGAKFPNPSTLPTGTGYGVAFSPSGTDIAVGHETSPRISAYAWSASGFGAKYSNPSTLPPWTGYGMDFSPAGTELAVSSDGSPYIVAYPWSASGFGTKFTDPATTPSGSATGVDFSPAGTEIAVSSNGSPYIFAYPWSASGFGTKFADPATLPSGAAKSVAFSPSGEQIVVGHSGGSYVTAYSWSASGFGAKLTSPTTTPFTGGLSMTFSPSGTELLIAHSWSPYLSVYEFTAAGIGAKFANPSSIPAGQCFGVTFSVSGTEVFVAHSSSPYITAYAWSASGLGAKASSPSTLPAGQGNAVASTL